MRYSDGIAFRQALEQRLKTRAGGHEARLVRDRKRVAFDRLLARLAATAPDRWLLKGGFALDLRLAERARTGPPADRLGGSHRFRVLATLAARQFETFLLDVGFRPESTAQADTLRTGDLLSFAGIDPVTVRAIPLELQVAEKLHAYTRIYEDTHSSTRAKDLIDLALIAELFTLDAATLQATIKETFTGRGTHHPPPSLPPPPEDWSIPYRQLAQEVGIAEDLNAGHSTAAALLDPVLDGETTHGHRSPTGQHWITED
jgi:hypothetical protein